jgi:IS30 family transposase
MFVEHSLGSNDDRNTPWDQGPEMGNWKEVSVAADIDIYFWCLHAPWQRGTSENTADRLLRPAAIRAFRD